jgi:predicted Rossmann fold flavoprotein
LKRIAVIGGGASGLMAACFAANGNSRVTVFERQKKIGRKILVSGNGRCNITNRHITAEKYHGRNPHFVHNVFARFGLHETVDFFKSIGIPLIEENDGKLFPASLQASAIVKVFEYELAARNVEIKLHNKIERIIRANGGYTLVTAGREEHDVDSVILSAGSCAFPPVGGSRSGYELALQMGHTVHEPFPVILPLTIPLKTLHRLQGIKCDCGVKAVHNAKTLVSSNGEILFTAYGISGPASLDISREVNSLAVRDIFPDIIIDFFPRYSADELSGQLEALWKDGSKSVSFSLIGIIKRPMPEVLLGIAGIEPHKPVHDLTQDEKKRLAMTLKGLKLTPGKPRGFDEAVVAAGGVDVDEVDPATMESRLAPGMHITGELLDIDGDSGGYNLQFAWSTGAIAGKAQHR